MGASAVAIVGLLALYHKTYEQTVLDKAIACGQHLLEHRINMNGSGSPKAWKSFEDKVLTGFSHGATGIAYALLRLYSVTQDSGLSIFGTDEIHQKVVRVLQTTQKFDLQGTDHLYGGNLGCCELLLLEAKKLSRPELLKMAKQRAAWVVARAKQMELINLH